MSNKEDLRPGSLRPKRLIPRWDHATKYMTRVGWRVLWMDGRGVQYFLHEKDAMQFAKDYIDWDVSTPEQCYLPKGARLRTDYHGPHPSIKRAKFGTR
jgi:hypothetical protein